MIRRTLALFIVVALSACVGVPDGVRPVDGFEAERYLGTWYEIARLNHRFERGLTNVSAQYSLREDGGLRVVNRGFKTDDGEWNEATGKAFFVEDADTAFLKVSFFGPFYGSYVVFELDKDDYQYAFVSGPNKSYLWFLSRTPTVDAALIDRFVQQADALGFDTSELIFVDQQRSAGD